MVGPPDELLPRQLRVPGPQRRQPLHDLLAGVLDRAAVEVGAGAGRGGRGVGHLVGAGRGEADPLDRQSERGGGDLQHLGVQALAHLGAAVVDQHRAVLVDVHQRPGLVEGGEVEGDAELHRRDRQAALGVLVRLVVRRHLGLPGGEVARLQHLLPRGHGPLGVAYGLAVRRGLSLDVEVAPPQVDGIESEQRRAAADDVLDDEHPLRPAEPAERRLRGLVGLRDPALHADVGDPVGVLDVAQRPRQHRLGQVEAPAAVGGQRRLETGEQPVVVEADPPRGVEAVPLAGHGDVLVAGQPQPHRTAGQRRPQGGDGGEPVGLHLLAAEAATHPQALHRHRVAGHAQHVGHDLLGLGRVLGAGLHEHLATLVDLGERAVGLEIEVLLPGELDLALEHPARPGQPGRCVAAVEHRLGALEAVGRDRLGHGHQRGQRLVVDLDGEAPRRAASRVSPSTQQTECP